MTDDAAIIESRDEDEAEVAAISAVVRALKGLAPKARRRIIGWAAEKYGVASNVAAASGDRPGAGPRLPHAEVAPVDAARGTFAAKASARRRPGLPSLDKSLDLRPKDARSFGDFATEKEPKDFNERNAVIVYWLTRVAGLNEATVDQVYTCYKDRGWRVPADLRNSLSRTASRKGWIDSSSMQSLKLTISGENFVEHELPTQPKAKNT